MWWCRYDSVTIGGDLEWQDQLNEKNKPFFDISDGIFVNYTWKVLYVLNILQYIWILSCFGSSLRFFFHLIQENYPKLSADVAGERKFDVYMGIDVFGRGTYGGGQWTVGFNILAVR